MDIPLSHSFFFLSRAELTNITPAARVMAIFARSVDVKRDKHRLPKLFYTVHASGRIFMRNLNISVVVLGSHTRMIYNPRHEIIETVGERRCTFPRGAAPLSLPRRRLYSLSSLERASRSPPRNLMS